MVLKYILLAGVLFFAGCTSHKLDKYTIARISEASGICFDQTSKTLYAVGDEGSLYQLTSEGKIVRKIYLGKYDLEGIACDNENKRLLLAVEGEDAILIIDPKTLQIRKMVKIKRTFKNEKILKKDKKHGLEGITIVNDTIYLSNQSKHKYPHEDPSVIIQVKNLSSTKTPILEIIDPRKIDLSGLAYYHGYLYMVSDTKDKLYRYNFSIKKIDRRIKLPKFAQEGITFDNHGNIYFADDDGRILKYRQSKIGL